MTRSVELAALDLRYESYRMRNPAAEARLLASLAERGIEEALEGVDAAGGSILLNGFKRYRCASKLRIRMAALCVAGRRRGGCHRHSAANVQRPIADDSGAGPLHRGIAPAQCPERGRHRRPVIAEQVLGEHATGSDGRGEHSGAGETLQRRVSGLSLHVHVTAVHAHERCRQAGHRRLRGGTGGQEAQRARD